ncbi:YoaK family protein [Spirosoma spitsbergense]|uniref:YoaK family protein n=1 Tax=Spirosoma spitsbergense TaxID=431554 RepID=UPI000360CC60|nr:YoaK family protein [Spirosoma spitsbergense]
MERQTTFILTFVTGFVDTVGFLALSGLFTAQITGNLVLVGASLVNTVTNTFNRLLLLPIFLIGGSITALLDTILRKRVKAVLPILLMIEGGLLLLFAGLGYYRQTQHHVLRETDIFFVGAIGVLAMAMQSSAVRLRLPDYVSTTVMTTNLTQFSIGLLNYLSSTVLVDKRANWETKRNLLRCQMSRYGIALLGFVVGTTVGALLFITGGLAVAYIPAGLVFWLVINCLSFSLY